MDMDIPRYFDLHRPREKKQDSLPREERSLLPTFTEAGWKLAEVSSSGKGAQSPPPFAPAGEQQKDVPDNLLGCDLAARKMRILAAWDAGVPSEVKGTPSAHRPEGRRTDRGFQSVRERVMICMEDAREGVTMLC